VYLYRHKKSDLWWCEFRRRYGPAKGKKCRRSTGIPAPGEGARGYAASRKRASAAAEHIRVKVDAEDLLASERAGSTPAASPRVVPVLTLSDLRDADVQRAKAKGVSDRQIGNLREQWENHLLRLLGKGRDARTVDEDLLEKYVATRRGETGRKNERVRGQTIIRERQALFRGLRVLKRHLKKHGVEYSLPEAPTINSDPRDAKQRGKLHDLGVLARWLAELEGGGRHTAAAQARIALECGLRREEIVRFTLRWLQPGEADGEYSLHLPEWATKDRDERTLPVSEKLAGVLVNLWRPGLSVDAHLLAGNYRRSWRSAARAIGYNQTITLRDLRHTFATLSLQLAGDLTATREALGHSELESTQRYLSATEARVRRAGLAVSEALSAHTAPTPPPPTPRPHQTPTGDKADGGSVSGSRGERTRTSGLLLPKRETIDGIEVVRPISLCPDCISLLKSAGLWEPLAAAGVQARPHRAHTTATRSKLLRLVGE